MCQIYVALISSFKKDSPIIILLSFHAKRYEITLFICRWPIGIRKPNKIAS